MSKKPRKPKPYVYIVNAHWRAMVVWDQTKLFGPQGAIQKALRDGLTNQ